MSPFLLRSPLAPLLRRAALTPRSYLHYPSPRALTTSQRHTYPRKDSQDKDSINTEATEYSKSASDDEGARQQDAAFDPNITDPQEQKDVAGKDTGGKNNPLDVSPANPEVNKGTKETAPGAESSPGGRGESVGVEMR
ncbi:MAG: hypothetical protein OHK93_000879 [Ramalina farinacea]|uniref:Uncharacterized protein n=1 Tax=Ramalina farinacea TaxID=258253 RepID=A0AA43QNE8_9LECA|nr:hypothetical protein [Ramalina farinacea]